MPETADRYPGATATAPQIFLLADSYRKSALLLAQSKGGEISRAPCRFLAVHAIELFLNAILRHLGHSPSGIRGMQHDVSRRTEIVIAGGLILRKRTMEHLAAITEHREYLVMRYGDIPATVSQINRLLATMEELAEKATEILHRGPPAQPVAIKRQATTAA